MSLGFPVSGLHGLRSAQGKCIIRQQFQLLESVCSAMKLC